MLRSLWLQKEQLLLRSTKSARRAIHVVGHPSAPIGMGEHARSVYRAIKMTGEDVKLVDIYGPPESADEQLIATYSSDLSLSLGGGVNIFCINGDEVELAFQVLRERNLKSPSSKNVIYPAWELSRYPDEWAKILDQFDEVWAPSEFIAQALVPATKANVVHMSLACEIGTRGLLSRKHFGVPDSSYCFLFAFDFLSYIERKNPYAVLEAFEKALQSRPDSDVRLIIKLNNTDRKPEAFAQFRSHYSKFRDRVVLINGSLSDLEMKSLMWLSDCFVSLHRSEGFGRGISEAMVLGKPVIATGYSGNMDFCTAESCFLVPYDLIPVGPTEYPHWQGQVWADADVDVAAEYMISLIDKPFVGEIKGRTARSYMASNFSFLNRGLDYANRCAELMK